MKSPIDPKSTLERREIHPGLEGFICPSSGGCWIDGETYWNWLRAQPGFPKPTQSTEGPSVELATDTERAVLSPRTGRLMRRFRVGSGLDFHIDYDAAAPGFWFDAGEFGMLVERSLHDEIHLICTERYQRKLRELGKSEGLRARRIALLGEEVIDRLESTARWLRTLEHPEVADAVLRDLLDTD